jgi:hypothetical protein
LEKLIIPVKQDRGNFKGGLVRYHDEKYFYINRKADISAKINLILEEIRQIDIPQSLISEELKKYLESNQITIKNDSQNVP